MGKTVKCDILVKKHVGSEAEWLEMYRACERAEQTKHISRQAAENVVKAAAAVAASGYSGPVAVVDLFTAKAETEAGAAAGVRALYVGDSYAILTDPRGEIAQTQANKQRQKQAVYDGGLFNR